MPVTLGKRCFDTTLIFKERGEIWKKNYYHYQKNLLSNWHFQCILVKAASIVEKNLKLLSLSKIPFTLAIIQKDE